jgi:hypothetical protein
MARQLPTSETLPTSRDLPKEETLSTYEDSERGFGWLLFAATMLGLAGALTIIDSIVALSRSKFYTSNSSYVFTDLRTWGWITLVVGVLLIVAAMGVFSGSGFARWFGIFAAGLNAIGLFGSPTSQQYPFWSLIIFALDVLVIYALAVYGGKRME